VHHVLPERASCSSSAPWSSESPQAYPTYLGLRNAGLLHWGVRELNAVPEERARGSRRALAGASKEKTMTKIALLCLASLPAAGGPASFPENGRFDPGHTVRFDIGDLTVVIGDHYEHEDSGRENYTGIHHLSHRLRRHNVFCPLYAGMIGVRRPCLVERVSGDTARLVVGEEAARVVETHRVVPPHYIDYSAAFTAPAETGFWNNTSYMNGPADPAIHILQPDGRWVGHYSKQHGHHASVAPAGMVELPPATKVDNAEYPHGSNQFHEGFCELRFDPKYPVYYGRFDEMVLIFMMERRLGGQFIPYMSPTGGGYSQEFDRPNPAWDHRFVLQRLTLRTRVVVRQRLCYKPYVDDGDVTAEYEKWLQGLEHEDR